jgi:hypothetical protein
MTWLVIGSHIIPDDDFRPHDVELDCWCHPQEDFDVSGVFIHQSMDGREAFESGERLTS